MEERFQALEDYNGPDIKEFPSPELIDGASPLIPMSPDYPPSEPPRRVSTIDMMCFEVDEEVFESTRKIVEHGTALYGHMSEDEIDTFIKSFFK